MRVFCTILLTTFLLVFAGQASAYTANVSDELPSGKVIIPKGTLIEAELISGGNSDNNDVHDIIYFKLKQNVIINGIVVLPSGTVGNAYVTTVRHSGFLGTPGGIALRVNAVQALNGATVPLTAELNKYQEYPSMYAAYLLLGFWDAGFHKLAKYSAFIHGQEAEFKPGAKFMVAVDGDADLGCTVDQLPVMMIKKY